MDLDKLNKYNLQIVTNYYKSPEEFEGNGLSSFYIFGRFEEDNLNFRIWAFSGNYFLDVGNNKMYKTIKKLRVQGRDFVGYETLASVILKYANELIDWYYEEYRDVSDKKHTC